MPLTVSPFVSLPTATTLPYTYKNLPSSRPQASTGASSGDEKARYVVAASGHAAHPDEIIASCKALQAHIQRVQDEADTELRRWDEYLKARDLAEKRRVAPGWLDSEARILEPERNVAAGAGQSEEQSNLMDLDVSSAEASGLRRAPLAEKNGEGEELDRAFGGMGISEP